MPTAKMIRTQSRVSAKYRLRRSIWCGVGYAKLGKTDRIAFCRPASGGSDRIAEVPRCD
jgi:hypothetical protein